MADEEYYLTAQYLVQIASRAKELFAGSEPEEKRLLLNMTLQNLRLDGKIVRYDWKKPFDKIAFYASRPIWAPLMGLYPTDSRLVFASHELLIWIRDKF